MDNKKPNDWVLNVLQNPKFSLSDFKAVGVDGNTTSIEDRKVYAENKIIQSSPEFKDSSGNFDNTKFNQFYDNALQSYQLLANNTFNETVMDEATFGFNNIWAPKESQKRTQPDFVISKIHNPDRRKLGTERPGYTSDRTLTAAEIAQTQKVYNPETDSWDESPNDTWLARNWFEPVALAQWETEDDHIDPETGRKIRHKKGDLKLNEEGTYYYEKLGTKAPYGRQLLSPFDVLTTDGSKANKYDFFDSDSLDKSVFGSVMKNTFKIAPMFLPYVGPVYVGLGIANELAKVLPVLYKTTFGLAGANPDMANKLEGFAYSMTGGTSEYAQQHPWAAENIFNMVGDVAKQLYEQRWIFTNAPKLFKKYGISAKGGQASELDEQIAKLAQEYSETAIKDIPNVLKKWSTTGSIDAVQDIIRKEAMARATIWGQNYMKSYEQWGKHLSRLYMTGTASYNAFSDAKEEGASDHQAAAVFWGYMAGMYALMSTDIGEHVLPELRMDKAKIKQLLSTVSKEGVESISTNAIKEETKDASRNVFMKLFNKAKSMAQNAYRPITEGSTSIASNSLAEGLEEVSEEVLYDVTKATFNVISSLSGDSQRLSSFNDIATRYGMSFFGGAIGGGIFQSVNDINIRKSYDSNNMQANQELIYLIRQGRGEEIYKALDDMRKKGALGDKNLSATKVDKDANGTYLYQQGTDSDNQNEAIYGLMKSYVSNIDQVLSVEGMKLSDQDVMSKQILSEMRYQELYKNAPSTGKILQDFNDLSNKFLKAHGAIDELNVEYKDVDKKNDPTYATKLQVLNQKLDDLRKEQYEFLHTGKGGKYLGLMMFSVNPIISAPFIDTNFRMFAESKYNKEFEDMSKEDLAKAKESYEEYLQYDANKKLDTGYDVFKGLNEKLSPLFQQTGELSYKQYAQLKKQFYNNQLQVTDSDGTVTSKSVNDIINDMFGTPMESDEDIIEKAEKLKRGHSRPFDEISRFMGYSSPNLEGDIISNGTILLQQLNQAADALMVNGYLDKEIGDVMRVLSNEAISISMGEYEPSLTDLYENVSDEAGDLFRSWMDNTDLTIANLSEETKKLVEQLRGLEVESGIQKQVIEDVINHAKSFEAAELSRKLSLLNDSKALINKINKSKSNPLYDLLTKIGINVTGKKTNVFNLLQELEQQFLEVHISDFALDDKIRQDQLRDAKTILKAAKAVIYASQYDNLDAGNPFGFNVTLKEFYQTKKIENAPELGLIDSETATLMNRDISRIESKLDFIERLSNLNKESQLKEQRRTSVNMNYLFFDVIGNEDSFLYTTIVDDKSQLKTINGQPLLDDKVREAINNASTLRQLTEDQNRSLDISDEDYTLMEKERVAIEDALYDRFQEMSNGQDSVGSIQSIMFNGSLSTSALSTKSEGIRSTTKVLADSEKLAYASSIFGVKSSDFLSQYYTVIKGDTSKLAPIATQEFAVRLGYTLATNKLFINNVVKASKMSEEQSVTQLLNTVFIEGIPGAGKTKAVVKIIYQMLKATDPSIKTWTVGPYQKQSANLEREIGAENNITFTKDSLFVKLDTDPEFANDGENMSITVSSKGVRNIIINGLADKEYSKENLPSVMFVDEATHFTNGELQIMADFADKNNVALILLGDTDQDGEDRLWNIKDGNKPVAVHNSFETTFCLTSPKLSVSMRESNTNKRDNTNKVRAVMAHVTPSMSLLSAEQKWAFINDNLEIKHVQDATGIHGEKLTNSLSLQDLELMLSTLGEGEVIGFIYDDSQSDTYKTINALSAEKRDKIEFYTEKEAQGNEAKYFIIDVDWTKKRTILGNSAEASIEVAKFIRSLYTIITRSEEGTVIIDNKLSTVIKPEIFTENDYNAPTSYTDSSLASYKEKRLASLEEVLKGYAPSEPVSKLRPGSWIVDDNKEYWIVVNIEDGNYTISNRDKTEYKKIPVSEIDELLGTSIHVTTQPVIPNKVVSEGTRPDLQAVLLEEAKASESGEESELERQRKAEWYNKEDPGFKVYTFAGFRSGIGLDNNRDSDSVTILNSGRKYRDSKTNTLVEETKGDLQALLNLDTFLNNPTKVSYNLYDSAVTLLANLRSSIMFAKTNDEAVSEVRKQLGTLKSAKWLNRFATGELQVKYINSFSQQTDQTLEMGDKETPNRKLVVYVLKDAKGNPMAEFTMGVLPGEFTLNNWVQNYTGNNPNIKAKWEKLNSTLAKGNTVAKQAGRTIYIPLGTDFALGANIISNTKISKVDVSGRMYIPGSTDLKITEFADFKKSKSRIVSDVFIMTNVGLDNDFYDKSLAGKAVAFVTTKKNFTWKGISAFNNPNLLAEAWMETRGTTDASKLDDVIKVVKLDPKGVTFEDYINGVSTFRRELANKTGNSKLFSPPGNKYTAARIFMNLLQFSADIKKSVVSGQPSHGVSVTESNRFNYEEGKIEIPSVYVSDLISSLDSMLAAAVNRVYGTNETEKLQTTNLAWGLTGEISQESINSLESSVNEKFNDYLENLKNYKDGTELANFSDSHSFTLAKLFHGYFAEYRSDSKTYELRTDATTQNTLKTLTKVLQNYELSYFKEGIYYTPVYKRSSEGGGKAEAMAYPAINMINNFTVNVEAQTPDFVITGDALQKLVDGIEQHLTNRMPGRPVEPDYTTDNANNMEAARKLFRYSENFTELFNKATDIVAATLNPKVPTSSTALANSIYKSLKNIINDRENSLIRSPEYGFIISLSSTKSSDGTVTLTFNTLQDVLSKELKQPITNITIDGSSGSALYSGNFEVNLQPYQWNINSEGKVSYTEIQNPPVDDGQKSEILTKLQGDLEQLENKKQNIIKQVVEAIGPKLAPKVEESLQTLAAGDMGTGQYTTAKTVIAMAFSRVPSELKTEWDALLSEIISTKDSINNTLGACEF